MVDAPLPPWAMVPAWVGVLALGWLYLLERYQNRLARLGFDSYSVYLETFHWSRVRRRALWRARKRCVACALRRRDVVCGPDGQERRVVLIVHHNVYHFGRERQKDLTVFCSYHHSVIHASFYVPSPPRRLDESHTGAAGPAALVVEAGASPRIALRNPFGGRAGEELIRGSAGVDQRPAAAMINSPGGAELPPAGRLGPVGTDPDRAGPPEARHRSLRHPFSG